MTRYIIEATIESDLNEVHFNKVLNNCLNHPRFNVREVIVSE